MLRRKIKKGLLWLPPILWLISPFCLPNKGAAFSLFLAMLLHEAGHTLAFLSLGRRVIFRLRPGGLSLTPERTLSYGEECFAALAGPFLNLLTAGLLPVFFPSLPLLREVSLLTAAVNLLPLPATDGGRALSALLFFALSPSRAEALFSFFSLAVFLPLFFGLLYLLLFSGGISVFFALWFLLSAFFFPS